MGNTLSVNDVITRLFAPSQNLPKSANKHAIVATSEAGEVSVTHSDLEHLVQCACEQLKSTGIVLGDFVVLYSENKVEYLPTLLACWALEATVVLIDYRMEFKDLLAACKKFNAKLLITSKSKTTLAPFSEAISEVGIEVLNIADVCSLKMKATDTKFDFEKIDLERPLLALFTSGTTGPPKTAVHNLRSLGQNIVSLIEAVDLTEDMTALTPLPVSHIFGLTILLVTQVLGMRTVLTALEPVNFIKAVHKYKPHLLAALPQFYGALLSAPKGAINLTDSKLLLCGGAPLTVSLSEKFEQTFGKQLNNGYGSTESKIFAFNKGGPVLSVGKPVNGVRVDIIDEQGNTLPEGKFGQVQISASNMMVGYLNDPEETRKVLKDGRYNSGDYGKIVDGYLFVVGRATDTVVVSGVVVHSGEVEAALRNFDQVKEVAVTAVSNKRLGQVIKASVVLMDEQKAKGLNSSDHEIKLEAKRQLVQQFKAFCKENLSRYKRPMLWQFLGPHDDLPKTLAGKVDKKMLERK